jgi:hypothetical protein
MANSYDPAYDYKNNPNYIKFIQQKEEIKKKYPPEIFLTDYNNSGRRPKHIEALNKEYVHKHRSLHKEYLKELADLIFQPNGSFQELTWDMIGEVEQLEMERKARGRQSSGYSEFYR